MGTVILLTLVRMASCKRKVADVDAAGRVVIEDMVKGISIEDVVNEVNEVLTEVVTAVAVVDIGVETSEAENEEV